MRLPFWGHNGVDGSHLIQQMQRAASLRTSSLCWQVGRRSSRRAPKGRGFGPLTSGPTPSSPTSATCGSWTVPLCCRAAPISGSAASRLQSLASLGPAGQLMRCAATLGEALSDSPRSQISNSTGATVYLHAITAATSRWAGIYDPNMKPSRHVATSWPGRAAAWSATSTAGKIEPVEILLIGRSPPTSRPVSRTHQRARSASSRARPASSCGGAPLNSAPDGQTRRPGRRSLPELYRRLLQAPWGHDGPRAACAALADAHGRTLDARRRHSTSIRGRCACQLLAEGVTFRAIKDEVPLRGRPPAAFADATPSADVGPVPRLQHAELVHPCLRDGAVCRQPGGGSASGRRNSR